MKRKTTSTFFIILSLLFCTSVAAQKTQFEAHKHHLVQLPDDARNISIIDGKVYCYASEVYLCSERKGEYLTGFVADTTITRIDKRVQYAVKEPTTGLLYFVVENRKGKHILYQQKEGSKNPRRVKRVKMGSMDVQHPTFSNDGRIMVFSAIDTKGGQEDYDLWCSLKVNGKWSKPFNLGDKINGEGDETAPTFYGNYLLFCSTSHNADDGHARIYATRLTPSGNDGRRTLIGRNHIQALPEPINDDGADNIDIAVDTIRHCGYYLSIADTIESAPSLRSFAGKLNAAVVWGKLSDINESALANVNIIAMQDEVQIGKTTTDKYGHYTLYLPTDNHYYLQYWQEGYISTYIEINTISNDDDHLIHEIQQDVTLERLPFNTPIVYNNLFDYDANLDLGSNGELLLSQLIHYLSDNSNVYVEITMRNDITTNKNFNRMLTDRRLQTVENHLNSKLPSTSNIIFVNGCSGKDGCNRGSKNSQLEVVIHDSKEFEN